MSDSIENPHSDDYMNHLGNVKKIAAAAASVSDSISTVIKELIKINGNIMNIKNIFQIIDSTTSDFNNDSSKSSISEELCITTEIIEKIIKELKISSKLLDDIDASIFSVGIDH